MKSNDLTEALHALLFWILIIFLLLFDVNISFLGGGEKKTMERRNETKGRRKIKT